MLFWLLGGWLPQVLKKHQQQEGKRSGTHNKEAWLSLNFQTSNINQMSSSPQQPQQQNIQPPASLLKYGNPVLVSTGQKKQQPKDKKGMKNQQTTHTEDILNSILPPREYTMEKQQLWIQCVSATPATKADVLELQDKLDKRLQQKQARETGICPIREELYAQCFDELIRQITINCAERGLLLVRVRDEVRMVIQTYQTLYESSIAFGMRKFVQEEQKKAEMRNKIKALENDCSDLTRQVDQLTHKINEMVTQDKEKRLQDQEEHQQEVNTLKNLTRTRVTTDLDNILTGKVKLAERK